MTCPGSTMKVTGVVTQIDEEKIHKCNLCDFIVNQRENYCHLHPETIAIHVGQEPDPTTGAVVPPISLATTFKQAGPGVHAGYEYSRSGNPTREGFETAIAAIECAKYGLAFASGSATTATIITMLPRNSHIISVNDVYGGTNRYFTKVAGALGYSTDFVDLFDPDNLKKHIKEETRLVWIESPTNPTLRLVDIPAICKIVKEQTVSKDLKVVVDNTFATPYHQNPLCLGADIVVHSVTKYINGHSDVVMGALATNCKDTFTALRFLQNSIGAVPSPLDCYLAHRGLKTLHVRMPKHCSNAMQVATFLSKSPHVDKVIYPGLPNHPQHELAKRQMRNGFGGIVTFCIKGDINMATCFLKKLQLFTLAESLGAVESLAELCSIMTHGSLSVEQREELGITDSLIRLSVGLENAEDLIKDLQCAFEFSEKKKM